jgi:hypothetical protein
MPHAPQFPLSVCVSTQLLPHIVRGAAHVDTQLPPLHTVPAAQTVPQPPQFELSDEMFTHPVLHSVRPTAHAQVPSTHVRPSVHALPHAPQFAVDVWSDCSQPFPTFESQSP